MLAYELLKAAHIVAITVWFGGMIMATLLLARDSSMAAPIREWDRRIATPAMFASWALGLAMAAWAGWFASRWMMSKLAFVLALSAIHAVLSARLRRAATTDDAIPGMDARIMLPLMLAILCAIVLLVVIKPF
ncbi:membrane protein [Brucella endophytica]|uniref:Protoporphyrinogen IX oxidase n=1 Tax=Brucella endophytica TaxID=1963359 RepID=A0A916WDP8_9HYPH|nr:CopD family protein [Brucella endophytica]GGA91279.1 membrane protein [Brucella endophytica]